MNFYPLKFAPIFKEMIWGGTALRENLGKATTSNKVGESWELSGVPDNVSMIGNGEYAGYSLDKLIALSPEQILGKTNVTRTGIAFPLLIKFIDACDDLSIQVHPNDEQAKSLGSAGKTEMWYILNAQPNATLISGFSQPLSSEQYANCVKNNTLESVLQKHPVARGDVFFIPAGRVHAIGKGIVLLEIQQSSNITYRIFDYNRRDANGNPRQLHTEQAMQVIDYKVYPDYKTHYTASSNVPSVLAQCPYFTTNLLKINKLKTRDYAHLDSFVIYICTQGSAKIEYGQGKSETISLGETVLLPAAIKSASLVPQGEAEVVEVYVE
ncbi:mannose-6-phosphate isomerase [Bacteroidia bacterium]|nr:mannose-6-phosphate isomerase [Bacteroidia bacterium]GHT81408.1 mannose-6-phosphate isomerase [Bacteroidia bacterium]